MDTALTDISLNRGGPHWERVHRERRKAVLQHLGIKPARRQWAICVITTAIVIPEWALAKRETRLSVSEHQVWFRGRRRGMAKILERQDRAAGGSPEVIPVEWRKCPVCGRMLLSLEAEVRRRLDESSALGRCQPCGADCQGVK